MSYPPYPPNPGGGGPGYPAQQPGYPPSGGGNMGFGPGQPGQPGYPPSGSGGYPPPGPSLVPGYPPGSGQMPNASPGPPQLGMGGTGYPSNPTSYPPPQPGGYQPAPYPAPGYPLGGPPNPAPYPGGYPSVPPQPQFQNYGAPTPPAPTYPPPQQPGYPSQGTSQYPAHPAPPRQPPARPAPPSGHSGVAQATQKMAAMTVAVKTEGTVKPHRPFDAESDANVLRTAMKGFGTDEKAIISVLANRSNEQRQEVKVKFKTLYGKDLIKELKSELSSHFEAVVVGLMMTTAEYDAFELRQAMKGLGTDEACLIEILCTRTNTEIEEIKTRFKNDHKQSLEKAIISETSGHFKRLLVSQLTAARDESAQVDVAKAKQDAQDLYKAGEARWGTDESKFNTILASRSYAHLAVVFKEYSKVCKYDIEQSIKREMSGDLEDGMLAIVKCVKNKQAYFAERLYKSMKGLGTDDSTLVRVMVSRCEVDMVEIKKEFMSKYHKTLGSFIKGDTSGDYKRILMALAGEN